MSSAMPSASPTSTKIRAAAFNGTNKSSFRSWRKAPNFWDEETVRHNVIHKYSIDQINGTEFDPDSIMLYFFSASWTLNGIATKANEVLSMIDKQFVAGAKMYPK